MPNYCICVNYLPSPYLVKNVQCGFFFIRWLSNKSSVRPYSACAIISKYQLMICFLRVQPIAFLTKVIQ